MAWASSRVRRAHPRVGGENLRLYGLGAMNEGSSPRGRGKRDGPGDGANAGGLIPAWAGKTNPNRAARSPSAAHPRVGGENQIIQLDEDTLPGSSPRGRGKRGHKSAFAGGGRLIPAWAGKTVIDAMSCSIVGAHPRVGGENSTSSKAGASLLGSSPRGRGKLSQWSIWVSQCRLIPAWAGKTGKIVPVTSAARAHPRVGGENSGSQGRGPRIGGSSPRGRGKHMRATGLSQTARLIPAWAGKTQALDVDHHPHAAHPRVGGENPQLGVDDSRERAHPRVGGENGPFHDGSMDVRGSSPRGRGKHRSDVPNGNVQVAHPRVGGENAARSAATPMRSGSSPRGRGKPG